MLNEIICTNIYFIYFYFFSKISHISLLCSTKQTVYEGSVGTFGTKLWFSVFSASRTLSPPLVCSSYRVYKCGSVITCVALSNTRTCLCHVWLFKYKLYFFFLTIVFLIAEFQRNNHLLFIEGKNTFFWLASQILFKTSW